jgi:hypothetical protein
VLINGIEILLFRITHANPHSIALCVDGGLNPRKFGAREKTGTEFAVDPMVATMLAGGPLSMPLAAEGGGRSPAFTGAYPASHNRPPRSVAGCKRPLFATSRVNGDELRAVYARILAAANTMFVLQEIYDLRVLVSCTVAPVIPDFDRHPINVSTPLLLRGSRWAGGDLVRALRGRGTLWRGFASVTH